MASPSNDRGSPSKPTPAPKARGRARSGSIRTNPLEVPLTPEENSLVSLIQSINRSNNTAAAAAAAVNAIPKQSSTPSAASTSAATSAAVTAASTSAATATVTTPQRSAPIPPPSPPAISPASTPKLESLPFRSAPKREPLPTPDINRVQSRRAEKTTTMNYQNYIDQPAAGPSNPRQAPPSPSQNMSHANGMNAGMGGGGGMVGFPTPAGHQSDLNFIMQMVEDLSRQLEINQRMTASIVEKIGKVRERAKNMDLTNDELIALVSAEMNEDTNNLEKENSELRQQLDKSEYNKVENWKLAVHGANILSDILEKMHKFKEQHEKDTLAWHKNYRKQLADEREENLNLRNQINDMKAAACRANEHLRGLRRWLTDHDELNELRIQNIALRQEKRSWKRMALPHLHDSDSEFSDDDDLIDPEEKKRLAAEAAEKRKAEDGKDNGEGGSGGEGVSAVA